MSKGTIVKVACDIYWAFTNKVAAMSSKYEISLCNLSEAAVTNLTGLGLDVKFREDKPEQGNYISCRSTLPIEVLDSSGNVLDALIGNGSKAIASIGSYEWTFKNKKGISPTLKKLVITDLVRAGEREDEDAPVF